MKKVSPKIEAYIKECQYEKESYEVEMFPSTKELLVDTDEVIAFSGNTGGSGGPHLHFEIRETETEFPVNPLLFGFDIKDDIKPGTNGSPSAIQIYPAEVAAKKMEKKILQAV
mgnify:CR=1 FL=1